MEKEKHSATQPSYRLARRGKTRIDASADHSAPRSPGQSEAMTHIPMSYFGFTRSIKSNAALKHSDMAETTVYVLLLQSTLCCKMK